MPPYQQQHPVLLHDSAIYDALPMKSSLRNDVLVGPSSIASTTTKNPNRICSLGNRTVILLDEHGLQQALTARSQRRRAAGESDDRRRTARISMDGLIDSSDVLSKDVLKQKLASLDALHEKQKQRHEGTGRVKQHMGTTKGDGQTTSKNSTAQATDISVRRDTVRPQQPEIVNRPVDLSGKKEIGVGVGGTEISQHGATSRLESDHSGSTGGVRAQESLIRCRPTRHRQQGTRIRDPSNSQKLMKPAIAESSKTPPKQSTRPVNTKTPQQGTHEARKYSSARNTSSDQEANTMSSISKAVAANGPRKIPSKRRIVTSRSATANDNGPDRMATRNHLSSHHNQSTRSITDSKCSEDSSLNPSSSRSRPPTSWTLRSQNETGCVPNQYITKETMSHYTNALGGVKTVSKTIRIFYDTAKEDPNLQVFFNQIQKEDVRNEFIILANLSMPAKFDASIKGILHYHCQLLENGADIEKLITLWESAIESSWLENRMDDSRQLIVGPSRVLFNLRALERQYAMYLMGRRAAARRSKRSIRKDDEGEHAVVEHNVPRSDRHWTGIFGRFRKR